MKRETLPQLLMNVAIRLGQIILQKVPYGRLPLSEDFINTVYEEAKQKDANGEFKSRADAMLYFKNRILDNSVEKHTLVFDYQLTKTVVFLADEVARRFRAEHPEIQGEETCE